MRSVCRSSVETFDSTVEDRGGSELLGDAVYVAGPVPCRGIVDRLIPIDRIESLVVVFGQLPVE